MQAPPVDEAATNRRRLAPTSSAPTTAEIQAQRHGIPLEISQALQGGVGMRIRQATSTGRQSAFSRTQSVPIFQFGQNAQNRSGGFVTHQQAMADAQAIISREELRRREVKPFSMDDSSDIRALDLSRGVGMGAGVGARQGSPDRFDRRLVFRPDGTVFMSGEARGGSSEAPDFAWPHGRKRGKDEADAEDQDGRGAGEGEGDDDKTEVDEDEAPPSLEDDVSSSTLADEFPPVFRSPAISQPELFGRAPAFPAPGANGKGKGKGLMLPPPVPAHARGMGGGKFSSASGRALGKTVSAPVHIGPYAHDVDMERGETDGFDVSEWAKAAPP